MSNPEIIATIREMQEYTRIMDEAKAAAEVLRDKLKEHMGDLENLIVGPYKLVYKPSTRTTIDGKRLAADRPDIYDAYTSTSTIRPLRVY